ncbi:TspO/MBR family protein [Parasphingorhabdus cellanae]|uniref:Tryptophan-rich sensory protein n=1 Tax=Parasphingorhabdus cellanae TaxID=2806553 RepID=A0ABX7T6M5_9SPHN|nr:TspO/MBR family protein [Parasphingorhabdus cellanae]QTD57246.1 tryptophan-rich sensory protein [Parasphingorhabdus cellanae]
MNQIASKGQLRMSLLRWALFIVPLIVLLGFLAAQVTGPADENRWFQALVKPAAQPPDLAFPIAWTILYVMIAIAFSMILNARGAPLRGLAIILFIVQFALNLAWSPLFFGMHQVSAAFWLLVAIFATAFVTTLVFGRVRKAAAWLMVPYLAWLCFAAILNKQIDDLNPGAETLVVPAASTQI